MIINSNQNWFSSNKAVDLIFHNLENCRLKNLGFENLDTVSIFSSHAIFQVAKFHFPFKTLFPSG